MNVSPTKWVHHEYELMTFKHQVCTAAMFASDGETTDKTFVIFHKQNEYRNCSVFSSRSNDDSSIISVVIRSCVLNSDVQFNSCGKQ